MNQNLLKLESQKNINKYLAIGFTILWVIMLSAFLYASDKAVDYIVENDPRYPTLDSYLNYYGPESDISTPYDGVIFVTYVIGPISFILLTIFWILFWVSLAKYNTAVAVGVKDE